MQMKILIKRTITALILLPVVIWLILGTSIAVFQLVSAALCLAAAWEWAVLMPIKTTFNRFFYVVLMLAALTIAQFIPFKYVVLVGTIWWLLAIIVIWHYIKTQTQQQRVFINGLIGFLAIIPCWAGLNSLRSGHNGAQFLLFFLFLLWAIDTGAYLSGTMLGKRKLMPRLSPGKTVEGVLGGFLLMIIILLLGFWILHIPSIVWLQLTMIAIGMNIFAIIGDLFESMIKRKNNVKDSGHIMPGHGGVLDRMDSVLAAAPMFALAVLLTGLGH